MMDFLSKYFVWIIGIIVIGVFVIRLIILVKKAKRIDNEGIVTDAVVSRIGEVWDAENQSSAYTTFVTYRDLDGNTVESPMVLSSEVLYDVGEQVKIRFIPGEESMVRVV